MPSNRKVFLGLDNIAGILTSLKKGFEQNNITADFYSFDEHVFGYKTDKTILYSRNSFIRKIQKFFLICKFIFKYDYFIFDSGSTLLPGLRDIKLFRFFGRKTMVIFTGCDIRLPEKVEKYKWNPCRNCSDSYKNFVGCYPAAKPEKVRNIENKFDHVLCAEEVSGSLSRDYVPALFPIDVSKFNYKGSNPGKILKILHAPSNPEYKGTKYITDTVNKLKTEFEFDFKIVENVKAEELYREIENSDLIIDQMLVGFYGLFAIESMAFGKPVICCIREDILKKSPSEMPVINADPDTLYKVLKDILISPGSLVGIGKSSRNYIEKYHNAKITAKQYYDIFEGNQ